MSNNSNNISINLQCGTSRRAWRTSPGFPAEVCSLQNRAPGDHHVRSQRCSAPRGFAWPRGFGVEGYPIRQIFDVTTMSLKYVDNCICIYIYYIYADDVYKLYKFISCSVLKVHSLLRGKVAKGGLREGDQATRLAGSASGSPTH